MLVEFSQCLQTVDGDADEEAVESLVNLCVGYFMWDVAAHFFAPFCG